MHATFFIAFLAVSTILLFFWSLYQRRMTSHYRDLSRSIRKEKEAAISLMDNVGERLTRRVDLEETLQTIARYVVDATRAESGAVYLRDETTGALEARVIIGRFPPLFEEEEGEAVETSEATAARVRARRIAPGEGIVGAAAEQERPLLITDAEADARVPQFAGERHQIHSLVLCPMRVKGRALGVVAIVNKRDGSSFDSGDTFLLQALADQAAVAVDMVKLYDVLAEQQRLEQEIKIAQEFQRMLIPRRLPELSGYSFGATCDAALNVGGDFFDFFDVGEGRLGVAIGDVSGKGIPGALIMAMVRSVLRAEARLSRSPADVLRRVNERILLDTKDDVFVTITYGVLEPDARRFTFVRAGHEPTLVYRARGETPVETVKPEGMAVGLMPPEVFDRLEEVTIDLGPGDAVLLYTDGVIEAVNRAAEEFSRERLIEAFAEQAARGPAQLVPDLCRRIDEFARGTAQHDDITMVAFGVDSAGSANVESQARPAQAAIEQVHQTA